MSYADLVQKGKGKEVKEVKVATQTKDEQIDMSNWTKEQRQEYYREQARKNAVEENRPTKSQIIRTMYDEDNLSISEIAKKLGIRYQFVYQVIQKHTGGEVRKANNGPSKSQTFREMFDAGMTVGQIAKETQSNYTFVFQVIKKYKQDLASTSAING